MKRFFSLTCVLGTLILLTAGFVAAADTNNPSLNPSAEDINTQAKDFIKENTEQLPTADPQAVQEQAEDIIKETSDDIGLTEEKSSDEGSTTSEEQETSPTEQTAASESTSSTGEGDVADDQYLDEYLLPGSLTLDKITTSVELPGVNPAGVLGSTLSTVQNTNTAVTDVNSTISSTVNSTLQNSVGQATGEIPAPPVGNQP